MSPKLATVEVAVGRDSHECRGVTARRSVSARGGQDAGAEGGGDVDGRQLPPGEAVVAAVPDERGERTEAPQRGARLESREERTAAGARPRPDPRQIQRAGR